MAFYGPPILFLGQKDTQKKTKQKTKQNNGHNEGSKAEVEIQV